MANCTNHRNNCMAFVPGISLWMLRHTRRLQSLMNFQSAASKKWRERASPPTPILCVKLWRTAGDKIRSSPGIIKAGCKKATCLCLYAKTKYPNNICFNYLLFTFKRNCIIIILWSLIKTRQSSKKWPTRTIHLFPVLRRSGSAWSGSWRRNFGHYGIGRMLNEDYKEMLQSLLDNEVEFLIVGAYAMAVYGYPRATGDLDLWVFTSK